MESRKELITEPLTEEEYGLLIKLAHQILLMLKEYPAYEVMTYERKQGTNYGIGSYMWAAQCETEGALDESKAKGSP